MKITNTTTILVFLFSLLGLFTKAQTSNVAPILTATGNQIYCPGTPMKIVTNMTIVDPDDPGVTAIYIQISSGYVSGEDLLTLTGLHPTITSSWDSNTGKLTLSGLFSQPTYAELEAAIEDVEYSNSSFNPSGVRTFSISIGQANYLPSNGHYYQYIPNIGITWSDARLAATTNFYYGIQGYLATITAADEAQLAGEQSPGAGWIGGSDEQQEGVWRWMTGPEAGTAFAFTFWNTGEPNSSGNEDYTHITAPGVGIPGSWNDISNTGEASGDYQPKGYIVEYGGMPGDPIIQISTSTTITIPSITSSTTVDTCNPGVVTLEAMANVPVIYWYTTATGGIPIATGTSFTTPFLNTTTTFFADPFPVGCTTGIRTAVTAFVNTTPVLTTNTTVATCENTPTTLTATTTSGVINWYSSLTSTTPLATGTSFTTPALTQNTTYYIEGNNNRCLSITRIAINVQVNPKPQVIDENLTFCENETLTLNAGINNVTYLWSTSETTSTITISAPGTYSVLVTDLTPQGCSSTKTFTITQNDLPVIDEVVINGTTATIIVSTIGDYEYSIDGESFQTSNVFTVSEGGSYTAVVRGKNNCGYDFRDFAVLTIPSYFTPNGDGFNDVWSIKGMMNYPNAKVSIFNRYGKLIKQLNAVDTTWDGTLNNQLLSSDDYWFTFKRDDSSSEVKGHFSLKR
ncbi:T9SS type B sorting domain-containing protein [Flavobacterium sp.]|uniref:T9SS type B sorting domain-containing protein n=1 Tax=Flavobacterium sp. TaxID=239 RepID=UPI002610C753|nr:T9SS type B sorting domain-containing protein [Flavobacterium sp.]